MSYAEKTDNDARRKHYQEKRPTRAVYTEPNPICREVDCPHAPLRVLERTDRKWIVYDPRRHFADRAVVVCPTSDAALKEAKSMLEAEAAIARAKR